MRRQIGILVKGNGWRAQVKRNQVESINVCDRKKRKFDRLEGMIMRATKYRNRALSGALLLGLCAPMAEAATQEKAALQKEESPQKEEALQKDTELAEKSYLKGDVITAISLWRKVAERGYAPAQVRLAEMLDAAEDDQEAVKWYEKAAKQDNTAGKYGLGILYVKGEGVKKDMEKGRELILEAASKNFMPAMVSIRDFYKMGAVGLPVDPGQVAIWQHKIDAIFAESNPASAPLPVSAPANVEKKK